MKNVVFCLTRGYPMEHMYSKLIARNQSIAQYLRDEPNMDVLIFHEGNISSIFLPESAFLILSFILRAAKSSVALDKDSTERRST